MGDGLTRLLKRADPLDLAVWLDRHKAPPFEKPETGLLAAITLYRATFRHNKASIYSQVESEAARICDLAHPSRQWLLIDGMRADGIGLPARLGLQSDDARLLWLFDNHTLTFAAIERRSDFLHSVNSNKHSSRFECSPGSPDFREDALDALKLR